MIILYEYLSKYAKRNIRFLYYEMSDRGSSWKFEHWTFISGLEIWTSQMILVSWVTRNKVCRRKPVSWRKRKERSVWESTVENPKPWGWITGISSIKLRWRGSRGSRGIRLLGSVLNVNGEMKEEVNIRIGKAVPAFRTLGNIWKSWKIWTKTTNKLYKSNVRWVPLYAAETWMTYKEMESRLRGFECKCLRMILGVRWQDWVSDREVARTSRWRQSTEGGAIGVRS